MSRVPRFVLLAATGLLLCLAVPAFAAETAPKTEPKGAAQPAAKVAPSGTWQITRRPVNAAGKPCPFLPEVIQFFGDGTLTMSNIPGARLPYKDEVTPQERQALQKRYPGLEGQGLLLVKPSPRFDWTSTPMVYLMTLSAQELTLTAQGWETATFKRVQK